jgi:hypothetical protein
MNEYLVDRLRADIARLEKEVADMAHERGEIIVAEVVLAVICFFVGFAVGAWVT